MSSNETMGPRDYDTFDSEDIQRIYRAVADGRPRTELMQMIYDVFGPECNLAPPLHRNAGRRHVRAGSRGHAWLTIFCFAFIDPHYFRPSALFLRRSMSVPTS